MHWITARRAFADSIHRRRAVRLAPMAVAAWAAAIGAAAQPTPAPQAQRAGQPPASVDLSPNFDIPKEALYEHNLRIDTQQGVSRYGDQQLRTQLFRRFSVLAKPLEGEQEDGAVAVASFVVVRVAMRVEQRGQMVFDFDSDRPRVSDPATANLAGQVKALRALPDLEVVARLGPTGEAISVEGVQPLKEIAKEDEGAAIIMGFLGEHWFKGMCEQIWGLGGSKGSARAGDSWTITETPSVDTGQTTATRTTLKLKAVEDGEAVIAGQGRLDIEEGATVEVMPGADAEIVNNKAAIDARWSLAQGRASAFNHRFAMEVAMSMAGVDVVQSQDISQSLVEVQ